jgi:hypothetical protein
VNGEVDLASQQRIFDLFHEKALAADLREWRLAQSVAGRLDADDFALCADAITQKRGNGVGLIERKWTAAGADPEYRVHV